jgi:hypothetical protein
MSASGAGHFLNAVVNTLVHDSIQKDRYLPVREIGTGRVRFQELLQLFEGPITGPKSERGAVHVFNIVNHAVIVFRDTENWGSTQR